MRWKRSIKEKFLNKEKFDKHMTCWKAQNRKCVIFSFQFYVPLIEVAALITASILDTKVEAVYFSMSFLLLLVVPQFSLLRL